MSGTHLGRIRQIIQLTGRPGSRRQGIVVFSLYHSRCPRACVYIYIYDVCTCYMYTYICQRLKNIRPVTGLGGLFATRLVTESGGLATNPACNKPSEDCSTLYRGPQQGFVTEGPRQRIVTEEGGGDRDKRLFRVTAISIYIYIHIDRLSV